MTRWFLLYFPIFFAILIPSSGFIGPEPSNLFGGRVPDLFESFWKIISNLGNIGTGALKFAKEFIEYKFKELPDSTPQHGQEYDFIVVGAGSAGAVIASRLTEIRNVTVLLIEAGGHENLIIDIPIAAVVLQFYKPIDWAYKDGPSDNYCLGMTDRTCHVAFGRGMGGTSILNYMLAIRGNKHDYDEWADYTGDSRWSYNEMLKYFKKLEKFDVTRGNIESQFHNHDGPMRLTNVPYIPDLATSFVKAGEELGYPTVVDYNGRSQRGFGYLQTNQINGERLSTNRAYLWPSKERENLIVSMNSFVNKIIIDPVTKTARGVEFTKSGRKIEVFARKEVILSAGSIGSPKILMLSGVGPAKHLKSLNINVLKDAPVGERMTDHIAYGGHAFLTNGSGIVFSDFLKPTDTTISDYLTKRQGPLTTPGGISGLGYINVDDHESDRPNIELMMGIGSLLSNYLIHLPFAISKDSYKKYLANKMDRHAWLIWPLLMKPKSRGWVKLKSADPSVYPEIVGNYLSDPDDVRVFVKGIRKAIEVSRTKSMQKYDSQLLNNTVPGCERYKFDSDDYWECAARTFTFTMWHHSGTCRMGKEDDPTAVVNSRLQVKGIRNLRVADASVMPGIPTAHLNIPTIAVAERFSDILKSDHGYI